MSASATENRWPTWVNGQESFAVSLTDRGLAYGDGLFETMLFDGSAIPLLARHMRRLQRGCERLHIVFSQAHIQAECDAYLAQLIRRQAPPGIIKLIYTRGEGGTGYVPSALHLSTPTTILTYVSLTADRPTSPLRVLFLQSRLSRNAKLAGIKHLNRLEYVLAGHELSLSDADSGLLLDSQENVIEALHHNIFIVKDGTVITPALVTSGVTGVMREIILDSLAHEIGCPVHVQDELSAAAVMDADEVFLCNSIRGILPVKVCDNRTWLSWPITNLLHDRLVARWNVYAR